MPPSRGKKTKAIMSPSKGKKRKADTIIEPASLPKTYEELEGLPRAEEFKERWVYANDGGNRRMVVSEKIKYIQYYGYQKGMEDVAREYFFENGEAELLPFLPTLVEIQKTRMDPERFKSLEGICYQWKYEKVLKGLHIWKSKSKSDEGSGSDSSYNDSDTESETESESKNKNDSKTDNERGNKTDKDTEIPIEVEGLLKGELNKGKGESRPIDTRPRLIPSINNRDNPEPVSTTNLNRGKRKIRRRFEAHIHSKEKEWKKYIRTGTFARNFLKLKNSRILLELKEGSKFAPWIYLKTVEVEGKKTIGVFAGRNFPAQTGIGFYISHPWFKWVEPFTITPPVEHDIYLQGKHLLPEEEASNYMWFYDDKGFMTACDPISKPLHEKGQPQVVSRRRILGMGFHLGNESDEKNIVVDNNGCIKTTKIISVDTELIM